MFLTTRILLLMAIPAGAVGLILGGLNGLRFVAYLAMFFAVIAATAVIDEARARVRSARATLVDGAGVLSFFVGAFILAGSARWRGFFGCVGLASAYALYKLVAMLWARYRTYRSSRRARREGRNTDK
jgi:hypothetical protein